MKIGRKVAIVLVLTVVLSALLPTAAMAAENGSLWLKVDQKTGTQVQVVTDTVVTDGLIKLTYDSSVLTYQSTEVTEGYVAMYAVNAEEPGVVLISWVAPGGYTLESGAVCLIRVQFAGKETENTIQLTGSAHDKNGASLNFADAPDTAKLEAAVQEAEALKEADYTAASFAEVTKALEVAKAILADGTATQAEVDAAEEALRAAMKALVENDGTEETESTGATEGTEESKDPTGSTATKPTEDKGGNSDTGDHSHIGLYMGMALISAAAIVVLTLQMKKKGGSAV